MGLILVAVATSCFILGQVLKCFGQWTSRTQINALVKLWGAEAVFMSTSLNIGSGLRSTSFFTTMIADPLQRSGVLITLIVCSLVAFFLLLQHGRWMAHQYPNNFVCPSFGAAAGQLAAYSVGGFFVLLAFVLAW